MATITDKLLLKLVPIQRTRLMPVLFLTLLGGLFLLPLSGFASQNNPTADELKQKAQHAYIKGLYAEAAAINQEIVGKHPESEAARYAVQMLGTLYEDNIVDIRKAMKWDREYLEKYASPRQVSYYKEKMASLEKLMQQEEAFKTYQSILFANQGDEVMVKKFEALLKEHPDFLLKDKVQRELGYAYTRLDKRRQSYLAFQALSHDEKKLSTNDEAAFETASRYWQETSTWGWVAWGVVIVLWAAVLLMKPWKQLTSRSSIKSYLIVAFLWVLLNLIRMPTFYSMETTGYPVVIPDTTVYLAAGLNLTVLVWLLLLTKGKFWQTRPRALLWTSPVLTLLMTTAVFYLFCVYHPNGPAILDIFADTLRYKVKFP